MPLYEFRCGVCDHAFEELVLPKSGTTLAAQILEIEESIMLELRLLEGNAVIARRCIPRILDMTKQKTIVDGIRSLDEVEEFKKCVSKLALMAIHSSPETRFTRLFHRRRSDDAADWELFHERDLRELGVGLGAAIAMAEFLLIRNAVCTRANNIRVFLANARC